MLNHRLGRVMRNRQIIVYTPNNKLNEVTPPVLNEDVIAKNIDSFPHDLAEHLLERFWSAYQPKGYKNNYVDADVINLANYLATEGPWCFKLAEVQHKHNPGEIDATDLSRTIYRFTFDGEGKPSAQNGFDKSWAWKNKLVSGVITQESRTNIDDVLGIYQTDDGLKWLDVDDSLPFNASVPFDNIRVYEVIENDAMTKGEILKDQDFKGFRVLTQKFLDTDITNPVSGLSSQNPQRIIIRDAGAGVDITSKSENEPPGCCFHHVPSVSDTQTISVSQSLTDTPTNTGPTTPTLTNSVRPTPPLTVTPPPTPSQQYYEISLTEGEDQQQISIDFPAKVRMEATRASEMSIDFNKTVKISSDEGTGEIVIKEAFGNNPPEIARAAPSEITNITAEASGGTPETDLTFQLKFLRSGSAVINFSAPEPNQVRNCYFFVGESEEEADSTISYEIVSCSCPTSTATEWPVQSTTVSETPPRTPTLTPPRTPSQTASTRSTTASPSPKPTPSASQTDSSTLTFSPTATSSPVPSPSTEPTPTDSPTASQSIFPTPTISSSSSCTSPYPIWEGKYCDAPDLNPDCWETCDYCPCECTQQTPSQTEAPPPEPTPTKTPPETQTQSISVSETPPETPTQSISSSKTPITASSTCSPLELPSSWPEEIKRTYAGATGQDRIKYLPLNYYYGSSALNVGTISSGGSESPLPLVAAISYCTKYTMSFLGDLNVESFKILEDEKNIFPSELPFYEYREKLYPSRDLFKFAKSNEIEFMIQPNASKIPYGEVAFIKWQLELPEGSSQQRAADSKWDLSHRANASIRKFTDSSSEYEEGDIVCHNGVKYKRKSTCPTPVPCATPTSSQSASGSVSVSETSVPTPTNSNSNSSTTTTSPTITITISPSSSSTTTLTNSQSASPNPTPTASAKESNKIVGWFMVTAIGCEAISQLESGTDAVVAASEYNNLVSVIDHGRVSKDGSYGCGGWCLYKWKVNVRAHKNGEKASVKAVSSVIGPEVTCDFEGVNLNIWEIPDGQLSCIPLGEDTSFEMHYYSHFPIEPSSGSSRYCNCQPASSCPEWPSEMAPTVPDELIVPICEKVPEVASDNNPAQTISAPELSKFFKAYDPFSATTLFSYVELYIGEDGWPIELPFPEDAFTNGNPDPSTKEYQDHAEICSPPWEYYDIVFEDSEGKSFKRSGFYLPV